MTASLATANTPTVAVLMATYNGAAWVDEQIDSILVQQGVHVTLFIRDDLSSDTTAAVLQRRARSDARVRLVQADASSGSAGANFRRLLAAAPVKEFDYTALADQDDIWHPTKLSSAIYAMRVAKAAGYSSAVLAYWPNGRERVLSQLPAQRGADFLFEGAGQGCTFVISRQLASRVREFLGEHLSLADSLHYHDWLVYLLCRAWRLAWHFDQTPSMRYRQHAANEIGARGSKGFITRRVAMLRSGWYAGQVRAAAGVYEAAGGVAEGRLGALVSALRSGQGTLRNLQLAMLCLRYGRRRFADRAVVAFAALLGWL